MYNPLFTKLIKFCNLSRKNSPLEDFTTEILAGILRSDQTILNTFCTEILDLKKGYYSLETQKSYPGAYVDMVFYSDITLCFLENKVNSREGEDQLNKYYKILLNEKDNYKNIYLRYCTKYQDKKNAKDYSVSGKSIFKQFQWQDIYYFLNKNYRKNSIIESFLGYLEEYDMKSINEFNIQEIAAINNLSQTLQKMESNINEIIPHFEKTFGKAKNTSSSKFYQLQKYNRYTIYSSHVIDSTPQKWSQILLAFSTGNKNYPTVYIEIYCDKEHSEYNLLKKELLKFEKNEDEFYVSTSDRGITGMFEAPLSMFLASENQHEELQSWFIRSIDKINEFIKNTPFIPWSIKES